MRNMTIYLTGACNLRCKHCSVGLDQYKPRGALSNDELRIVLDRAHERGVRYVTLLGGEPTQTDHDLAAFARHAGRLGIQVSINTNLTHAAKLFDLLDQSSLANVVVSLDGAYAATHDAVRGRGMFDRTHANLVELVRRCRASPIQRTVDVTFALSRQNQSDATAIVDLVEEIGVDKLNVNIVQPVGRAAVFDEAVRGRGASYVEAIATLIAHFVLTRPRFRLSIALPPLVTDYIERVYDVPATPFTNHEPCGGTSVYTYVDLRGNLLPCPGLSFEEGRSPDADRRRGHLSIIDRPVREIERASVFRAFERDRARRRKNLSFEPCRSCRFRDTCSPCTSSFYKAAAPNEIHLCALVRTLEEGAGRLDAADRQMDAGRS